MDSFRRSCYYSLQYPKNLTHPGAYEYLLDKYLHLLKIDSKRLFSPPEHAEVGFWQFEENAQGGRDDFIVWP